MVQTTLITEFLFVLQSVFLISAWLYWLQTKEYRLDRFFVFLKSKDGVRELYGKLVLLKILTLLFAFFYGPLFFIYLTEIFILTSLFLTSLIRRTFRKPIFTKRVFRITLITLLFVSVPLVFLRSFFFLNIFLSEISFFWGILLGTYLTQVSVNRTLDKEKRQAQKILNKYSPVVIAITGSYGKSTTKDFIDQLLSSKYKVLSTYKNQNTHFGIVRRLISGLSADHKFFVAEVGAYKKGEIKSIAGILNPETVVITGLEPQHLELFGSFENLKDAKFELVESLREGGAAFFNLTNSELRNFIKRTGRLERKIKVYSYASGMKGNFDALSEIKKVSKDGIEFNITIAGRTDYIKTNIKSSRLIENLTGAILVARKYAVDWNLIKNTSKNLHLPEGAMNIFVSKEGIRVIDDSYNSTPHGFEAAIELLSGMKAGKKVVVTTGIIELGNESRTIHKKIGELLSGVCDKVILRNEEFLNSLQEGIKNKDKLILENDQEKVLGLVRKNLKKGDVLLVEGKSPVLIDYFKKK